VLGGELFKGSSKPPEPLAMAVSPTHSRPGLASEIILLIIIVALMTDKHSDPGRT